MSTRRAPSQLPSLARRQEKPSLARRQEERFPTIPPQHFLFKPEIASPFFSYTSALLSQTCQRIRNVFSYTYRLFCNEKSPIFFAFNRFHTLATKRGVGTYVSRVA